MNALSIRTLVETEKKKHQEFIAYLPNNFKKDIVIEMNNYESNSNDIYGTIDKRQIESKYNNISNHFRISHINYNNLQSKSKCYLNSTRSKIDIDKLFKDYANSNKTPFVVLEIESESVCKYQGNDIDFINAFNNIEGFEDTEETRIKIFKHKSGENPKIITLIIFYDSKRYNNNFIFANNEVENITDNYIISSKPIEVKNIQNIESKSQLFSSFVKNKHDINLQKNKLDNINTNTNDLVSTVSELKTIVQKISENLDDISKQTECLEEIRTIVKDIKNVVIPSPLIQQQNIISSS